MFIDKDLLQKFESCPLGFRWFRKYFPRGGEIQTVLDTLCARGETIWADWLLKKAGPQPTVHRAENLTGHHFFFAGSIDIAGSIDLSGCLIVGGDIRAGGDISAGLAIICGGKIESSSKPISHADYIRTATIIRPLTCDHKTLTAFGVFK